MRWATMKWHAVFVAGFVCVVAVLSGTRDGVRADDKKSSKRDDPNVLTDKERGDGWRLLFDGKTTKGWRGYRKDKMPEGWEVKDGALTRTKGGGDIVTEDEFDSFELAIEWKISEGGNSGIMVRVSEQFEAPYETGPEFQVLDNAKHADGRNPLTTAGSCYALYAPTKDVTRPVGEWNQARILVNGNHVEHWMNGEKIVTYDFGSADWEARLKKSKFSSMPRFGREAKGHIDLQDHGNEVAFRGIKIRTLPAKAKQEK